MSEVFKATFVYDTVFDTGPQAERLRALTRLDAVKSLRAIALDWAVLAVTIGTTVTLGRWWLYPFAVLVIGARQHALLILMHDAAHQRILPSKIWNERISNWFCAYPHFVATEGYRRDHLAHHAHLNTEKDPNWTSKLGQADWVFPKTRRQLAWIFLKEVSGFGLIRILGFVLRYDKNAKATPAGAPRARGTKLLPRLVYYAFVAVALTLLGQWRTFLLLWIVPFFSVLPALLRLRTLSEHHGLPRTHDMDHSRNFECNALERFFLAPHDVWLHMDHHLFPSIPFYNLRRAHQLLQEIPEYAQHARRNRGILMPGPSSVVHELTAA